MKEEEQGTHLSTLLLFVIGGRIKNHHPFKGKKKKHLLQNEGLKKHGHMIPSAWVIFIGAGLWGLAGAGEASLRSHTAPTGHLVPNGPPGQTSVISDQPWVVPLLSPFFPQQSITNL